MTVIDAADEAYAASGHVMGSLKPFITQVNPLGEFHLLAELTGRVSAHDIAGGDRDDAPQTAALPRWLAKLRPVGNPSLSIVLKIAQYGGLSAAPQFHRR